MSTSVRAVLFADVVGSTAWRAELGEERADTLRRDHDRLFADALAAQDGRVLRWTGDGVKADFATASAAVAAAVDLQRAVTRYGRSARAVASFRLRIGLAVGEVSFADDDVHGVAVIEAARLESLAEPGEILATDLVERLGGGRTKLVSFEPLGPHPLKGLPGTVEVVRVVDVAGVDPALPMPRAVIDDRRFPLVGRAEPLGAAHRRWEEASSGRATVALVTGQPGLGKSRFVAHVATVAHSAGATVLAGACDSDLDVPYQPFALAFNEAADADADLGVAVRTGSGPLGPLFPSRRSMTADPGQSARHELFDAVVGLLDRMTQQAPLLLILEDLHWATPPTVQLLRHVLRTAGECRVLVLATYRSEDVAPGHPLHDLLAEIRPGAAISRIDLRPLTTDEVGELVTTRVPAAPPERIRTFAEQVHGDSGGNPFFVCELLHHLGTSGTLEQAVTAPTTAEFPIPDSVRDIVGQRLGRVSAVTADLLQTAAIVGQTFDVDVLARVVDAAPESVLDALEDAERMALVREAAAGRYGFAHAIVRTTLSESTSATRRRLLHRRIAEAIEAIQPDEHDELARHWLGAGVDVRAYERLELAARRDLEALAYESAVGRYQSLIEYHRGPDATVAAARAWLGLGLARRAMGLPAFREAVEEAGRLARRARDVDLIAATAIASIWPGTMFPTAGVTDTAMVELCEDALDLVPPADPRRVRILSTLASHLTFQADRTRRCALLAEALELARAAADPALIGGVLVSEFLSLWDPSTAARRAEIAGEVSRAARATGDADLTFFGGFFSAIAEVERRDVDAAERRLVELDAAADATRNFYSRFLIERLLLSIAILQGRPGAQAEIDSLAARYADTHADTDGTWSIQTGALAIQAGTLGALVPTLDAMIGSSTVAGNWLPAFGIALAQTGDLDGANAILDRLEPPPMNYFWLVTMLGTSELVLEVERRELAGKLRAELEPFRDQLAVAASGSLCYGLVSTTSGLLALLDGDAELAVDLLRESVEMADALRSPFESTKARRGLAQALIALGDDDERARTLIDEATTIAEERGYGREIWHLSRLSGLATA